MDFPSSSVVLCLAILAICYGHPIPTYFGRLHPDGTLLDVNSPDYRLKINFFEFEDSSSKTDTVQERKTHLKIVPDFVENGAEVEVYWQSENNSSKTDFIALYCPLDDKHLNYLDYLFLNETRSTFVGGEGKFKVKLFNMRVNCELRYFHNDGNNAYLMARSNVVRFKANEPLQGHLALTGDPTEMRVMWTSGTDSMSVVLYGLNQTSLSSKASGKSSTYKAQDMCGEPANGLGFRHPGYIHDVLLTGLKPGIKYFFQFGSAEVMSKIFNFTAAPMPGKNVPFKFVAYGDMGVTPSPGSVITARESLKEVKNGAELVLHIGDISYARGYAYLWDQWHALIEPYATLVPYMVGIGNHEQDHLTGGSKDPSGAGEGFHPSWGNYGDDSGGECGVPMYKRFHMPENGNALWWYSFDYGSVHFVMMSTEHNYTKGSKQYKWLVEDLEKVDRSITPWIVFTGHRPMYTSQLVLNRDPIVASHMRDEFEDVLYKYKVDLTLWGHYHSYERTCPVYREKCVSDGPTYMVVGTAGFILELNFPIWTGKKWSAHHELHYGYGRVTVVNSTAMYWEWIKNYDQEVKDKVWIYRQDP